MILLLQDFFLFNYSFESLESFSLTMKKITKMIQKKKTTKPNNKKTKYSSKNNKIITRVKKQQRAKKVSLSNLISVTFSLYRLF